MKETTPMQPATADSACAQSDRSAGPRRIPFVDPASGDVLQHTPDGLAHADGRIVAPIIGGIPRFVERERHYAENFGKQWKTWRDTLSDVRSGDTHRRDLLRERTRFDSDETAGKTLLECGCGGGDDTEVLLQMGFGEVHAFDLSTAVERAAATIDDPRLVLSQASLFDIPYPDGSFDYVFCHRVLQHTPDPEAGLRAVCRKVRPGGVLFAHVYRLSIWHLGCFKYKLRWLTTRLPHERVMDYVLRWGPRMRRINRFLHRFGVLGRFISYNFVPFYYYSQQKMPGFDEARLLELDQLNTFDALTPAYDKPMTVRRFRRILSEEGFEIEHFWASPVTPLYATARRRR